MIDKLLRKQMILFSKETRTVAWDVTRISFSNKSVDISYIFPNNFHLFYIQGSYCYCIDQPKVFGTYRLQSTATVFISHTCVYR